MPLGLWNEAGPYYVPEMCDRHASVDGVAPGCEGRLIRSSRGGTMETCCSMMHTCHCRLLLSRVPTPSFFSTCFRHLSLGSSQYWRSSPFRAGEPAAQSNYHEARILGFFPDGHEAQLCLSYYPYTYTRCPVHQITTSGSISRM
jgi:hypothetical protein